LRTALACQEVFGTPVSELFAGINDSVAHDTRGQMVKLRARLKKKIAMARSTNVLAQKFNWVSQRLLDMPKLLTSFVV
jgi:hypothetical protein